MQGRCWHVCRARDSARPRFRTTTVERLCQKTSEGDSFDDDPYRPDHWPLLRSVSPAWWRRPTPSASARALMKKNSQHTKGISAMVKGEAPFDAAAVNAAFTRSGRIRPRNFPSCSPTIRRAAETPARCRRSGRIAPASTRRSPRLRRRRRAKPARSRSASRQSFPAVSKACGDCHEGYRAAAKKIATDCDLAACSVDAVATWSRRRFASVLVCVSVRP